MESIELTPEKAYLVGIHIRNSRPLLSAEESLAELNLLAETAELHVVGLNSQKINKIDPKTFIGSGKLEEIKEEVENLNVQTVIFDEELSPRHQKELEKAFGKEIKVLDRSALILDIFASHARTHEGRLQVELAQYEYLLPRLTRQWTHLARQAGGGSARGGSGGVGLRGPGEKQLEVDRRDIGRRISHLKKELEDVRAHRSRHRQQRHRAGIPVASLVGYTNAGKSTLLNALTGADIYIANQLFATLDPTTRQVTLPSSKEIVMSDTVGFIQKLPTTLIAAFRATLEEILEASIILHIVDASHASALQHIETVEDTLAEIDTPPLPRILVLNKCDRWKNPVEVEIEKFTGTGYDDVVAISALKKIGLDTLLEKIADVLQKRMVKIEVLIPYQAGELKALMYRQGIVDEETHTQEGMLLRGHVPPPLANLLANEAQVKNALTEKADNDKNVKVEGEVDELYPEES